MNNPFDEMKKAINEAEYVIRAAENSCNDMARLLRGRLSHVAPWILADLKRELRDFNIHTKEWKKDK